MNRNLLTIFLGLILGLLVACWFYGLVVASYGLFFDSNLVFLNCNRSQPLPNICKVEKITLLGIKTEYIPITQLNVRLEEGYSRINGSRTEFYFDTPVLTLPKKEIYLPPPYNKQSAQEIVRRIDDFLKTPSQSSLRIRPNFLNYIVVFPVRTIALSVWLIIWVSFIIFPLINLIKYLFNRFLQRFS